MGETAVAHDEDSLRRMFNELVNRLEKAEKVAVLFRGRVFAEEANMRGHFTPSPDADDPWRGRIAIFRAIYDVPEDALVELVVLAHEAGHYETFRDSLRPVTYGAAVDKMNAGKNPSEHERRLVWEEEVRAWAHAVATLRELGFRDWDGFKRCARDGLGGYEKKLGLPGALAGVGTLCD